MANTKVTGDIIASGTITAANLVSGTLDGILGTYLSTNSYATESYVTTAVSNLIDAAPASLDTLNELAAALNDDANFATTVTDSIATKLPLAGGNITGNLSVNTNALFVDAANNWVGIGTSSPSRPIHILAPTPGIKLEDTTGNDFGEIVSVDGDLYIRADEGATQADSSIRFQIDQSERVRIDSSGNVGIGTSPDSDAELHVYRNASAARVRVEREFNPKLDLESLSGYAQIGTLNDFPLAFQTNGTERLRITSSGNLGIGTTNPTWKFHLNTPSALAGFFESSDADTSILGINNSSTGDPQLKYYLNGITKFTLGVDRADSEKFKISTIDIDTNPRLVIDSSGRVGIGTSSPLRALTINSGASEGCLGLTSNNGTHIDMVGYGTTLSHPQARIAMLDAGFYGGNLIFSTKANGSQTNPLSERMRITSAGNVGIGTSSPNAALTVKSIEDAAKGISIWGRSDSISTLRFFDSTGATEQGGLTSTSTYLGFNYADTERMRIDSSGNVGIGTNSPGAKLTIDHSSSPRNYQIDFIGNISTAKGHAGQFADGMYLSSNWYYNGGQYADDYSKGQASIILSAADTTNSKIQFSLSAAGSAFPEEKMRIDSSGRILINGSATPSLTNAKLFISRGDQYGLGMWVASGVSNIISSEDNLALGTAGTERMRIDASGRVGIGTSNPSQKLHISGTTGQAGTSGGVQNGMIRLNASSGIGYGETLDMGMHVGVSGPPSYGWIQTTNVGGLNLVYRLVLQPNGGNVGIATTNPTSTLTVNGSLSKGSGSFKIDHPLKPKTHHLVHSFVESPQANNIYRGKVQLVDGKATINLDEVSTMTEGTFIALNRDIHTYTSNESDWDAVRGKVEGNILTIECQNAESTATVSWLVVGERQDKHMFDTEWTDENGKVIVEPEKEIDNLKAQLNG
jgi:hypothetical protein